MVGIQNYGAFVVAFIVLMLIPGPGNLALIGSAAQGGLRAGLASVLGLLLGDQVLFWLAVTGVASLMAANPRALVMIQWAGAAYLAWLGGKMLLAKLGQEAALEIRPGAYFKQTMMITLLNPKSILFFIAFLPQFISSDLVVTNSAAWLAFGLLAVTIFALGFIYCFGVVLVTHFTAQSLKTTGRFSKAKLALWLNRLAGLILLGFSLKLALGQ
jgi:threonine/homoserine/homoserine lactone efflux protein